METVETWRDLLGMLFADPSEMQRVATQMNMMPRSLTNWIAGKNSPHPKNLYQLLNVIDQKYRRQLVYLLKKEYPDFEDMPPDVKPTEDVPPVFVAQILEAICTDASSIRTETILGLVLNQISDHVDPEQHYVRVCLAICNPPYRNKVRSLYVAQNKMPSQLNEDVPHLLLLGIESLVGYVVSLCHGLYVDKVEREQRVSVKNLDPAEESAAAFPLLRSGKIAGALLVASRQPYFFTKQRQKLLEVYARLLSLAFRDDDFYEKEMIALATMPHVDVQAKDYHEFRGRVSKFTASTGKSLKESRLAVRQEIERSYMRFMIDSLLVKDSMR